MGEINSASAKTIMQVAARNKRLFMQIGARSDVLRGADCNRYTFHVDIPVTFMVNAAGQALLRDGLIKGKKIFCLTSDYLFGHDSRKRSGRSSPRTAARWPATSDRHRRHRLQPVPAQDPQARPDMVATNLAATRSRTSSSSTPSSACRIRSPASTSTRDAWAAGEGNLGRHLADRVAP